MQLIALATVLCFNSGARAAPAPKCDDDADTELVSKPAKSESFGVRMAKARAAKGAKGKGAKAHKTKAAKAPRIPKAPKIPTDGS